MSDTDETQIRELIQRWAAAVRAGDLAGVLADHDPDIVMFDVPPPENGVRGLDAYRRTWPPFFEWISGGAVFEIVESTVVAGADTAFAYALLRCGAPGDLAAAPDARLRLTLGLRKTGDRWVVAHEHHSFTDDTYAETAAAETELREMHREWFARTAARDLDGLMAPVAEDVVSYEHEAPLAYAGLDQVRAVCRTGLEASAGGVTWDVPDMQLVVNGDLAASWGLNRMTAEEPDGTVTESWSRGTRVFRRRGGRWVMVHQHVSFPYDPATGAARADLRP